MQLWLTSLTFLVDCFVFLIAELIAQLWHSLLIFFGHTFTFDSELSLLRVLKSADFVFVTFNDSLDFWFESLDSLSADFMDLFLFPLFFANFLCGDPCVFVLLEFNLETIVDDFLLTFKLLVSCFDCIHHLLKLLAHFFLVSQKRLNHVYLLLNSDLHLLLNIIGLSCSILFDLIDSFMCLASFFLAELL